VESGYPFEIRDSIHCSADPVQDELYAEYGSDMACRFSNRCLL